MEIEKVDAFPQRNEEWEQLSTTLANMNSGDVIRVQLNGKRPQAARVAISNFRRLKKPDAKFKTILQGGYLYIKRIK